MDEQPTHHTSHNPHAEKFSILALVIISLLIIVVIALSGGAFYYYSHYTSLQKKMANPTVMADEDLNSTIDKVSKLMELPSGEKPILATVTDREKLGGQPFFDKAQLGDKVLIFVQAKKAVLYRPSTNRVINVAPVALNLTPTPKIGDELITPGNTNQPIVTGTEQNIENNPEIPQPTQ